jgi:hypothetical protein
MPASALELRPRGAVAILDSAVRLCARHSGPWALTLPAGALLTAALLHVAEQAQHQRPLAGPVLLLTLAWCARGLLQGAACHHVQELLLGQGEPSALASLRAALARAPSLVAAAGYLFALNALTLSATLGLSIFFLSAHAVGYAAMLQGRGSPLGLYGLCSQLLGPARANAARVRLLMAVQLLAFFNLHIAANALLYLGRKLLALELTFAERFASLDNTSWLLFLAALTFTLFEPLRAAAATLLLIDGRVRQEGLDLLALVQQLPTRTAAARTGVRSAAAALLLALATSLVAAPASAQEPPAEAEGSLRQRLDSLAVACEWEEEHFANFQETLDTLSASESLKFQRLLRRVERQVYEEEDCSTFLLLNSGLVQADQVARQQADGRAATQRAQEILSRPEFAVAPPPATEEPARDQEPPGWWKRFKEWLDKVLEELFKREEEEEAARMPPLIFGEGSGMQVANALVVVLIGAVLLVLGVVLYRALRNSSEEEAADTLEVSAQEQKAEGAGGLDALARPPEGWAHLADELAARGEYREAVRHLYLALLSRLHREGAILYDVTLSNWDYLRQFRGQRDWLPPFRELTRRFDFAWYGRTPVGAEGYRDFRALCAPMLATATAGEATRA